MKMFIDVLNQMLMRFHFGYNILILKYLILINIIKCYIMFRMPPMKVADSEEAH